VDEGHQTVTLAAWIELIWRDELLSWRPKDYEGIEAFELPPDKLWNPVSVKDVEGEGWGWGWGRRNNDNVFITESET
jgi:hypothetical protein